MLSLLLSLLPLLPAAAAFNDDAMRSKKVYQLVTDRFARDDGSTSASCDIRSYCGGTWKGVASKLDYIKGMGFDTVWISPVVDNIEGETPYGEAYHGYWTRDPDQLNANFGSPEDLRSLASSLHDKEMFLMVDVVVNHVASTAGQNFQTNSSYGPFSSQDDFHPFCWVDNYENQTNVEQCWLGDDSVILPDLNTQSQTVIDYWNNWIRNIVSNYTVDAIRLDTVKHVPHEFWSNFVEAAGVANVGEILDDDAQYIGSYQQNGSVNPFNYAVWGPLTRAFNSSVGSLEAVSQMVRQVAGNSTDPSLYGSFLNNHDNARFESKVSDRSQIYNAHAYPFVTDGVPYLYYGSENGFKGGNDPDNREAFWPTNYDTSSELYLYFKRLNSARDSAAAKSSTFYRDQMSVTVPAINDMLVVKGPLVSVLTNAGSGSGNHTFALESSVSGWPANTQVLDVVQCESFTTDGSGNLNVVLNDGMPRVMLAQGDAGDVCDGYVKPSTATSGGGSGSGGDSGNGAAGLSSVGPYGVIGLGAVVGLLALL